jgi:hypothetical protein
MQYTHKLDYAVKSGGRRRGGVVLPLGLLLVVGVIIWAYRPPHDMSTLLGGPEEEWVSALIAVLAVVWVGILIWCVIKFRPAGSAE